MNWQDLVRKVAKILVSLPLYFYSVDWTEIRVSRLKVIGKYGNLATNLGNISEICYTFFFYLFINFVDRFTLMKCTQTYESDFVETVKELDVTLNLVLVETNHSLVCRVEALCYWQYGIESVRDLLLAKDISLPIQFFTVCTKLPEMALLYSKELTTAEQKLPPAGLDLMQEISTGLGVQCLTIWAKLTFACKSKTFRSLYSHALLIIAKSSQIL